MAKYNKLTVGSVLKSKEEGKGDYIKIAQDVVLKKGDYLNLESPKNSIKSLKEARETGKITGDWIDKRLENLEKIKDFVRFEIVKLTKQG